MKSSWAVLLAIVLLSGCAAGKEKFEMYADNPEFLIKDPHFYDYQEKMDDLEKLYLNKKITYAEYLDRKKEVENGYTHEVQKREQIIMEGQ